MGNTCGQQVHTREAAVAAEHVGVAGIAREHHARVRQIAQAIDCGQPRHAGGLHNLQTAGRALHHHAEIAGAANRTGASRRQRGNAGQCRCKATP